MANKKQGKNAMAGGIFIALGLLIGTIFGLYIGQSSLGMIAGFSFGCAAAVFVWLLDRTKGKGIEE